MELKKIIELIKQNTYEKKNTIPEALKSTKEKHILKKRTDSKNGKIRNKTEKKISETEHADSAMLLIGHQCKNVPHWKLTATNAERKDITRKHADRNSTTTTEIQKITNRYQDVNKNEVKFRGKFR